MRTQDLDQLYRHLRDAEIIINRSYADLQEAIGDQETDEIATAIERVKRRLLQVEPSDTPAKEGP